MAGKTTPAAAKPAAKKPTAKKAAVKVTDALLIDGIFVRSLLPSFRRAGFTFNQEGFGLQLSDLSTEQLAAIEGEPMLSVTHAQFPATETDDAKLAELAAAQARPDASENAGGAKDAANEVGDSGNESTPSTGDQSQGDQS